MAWWSTVGAALVMFAAASGLAADPAVETLLLRGAYADASAQYERIHMTSGALDALFNAAFYRHRAGERDAASILAQRYLDKAGCDAEKLARRIRHCAVARELTGDYKAAIAEFERYKSLARDWRHRSRADGSIERVELRRRLAAAEARTAELARRVAELEKAR